jgi:glutamate dehydrogenase/leucine dehydrogenase
VAIEGYGNAGSWLAILLEELGYPVIAVSDSKGAVVARDGLPTRRVLEHKRETGSVVGFEGAETINGEDLFQTECQVLVLAALEETVTADNAGDIAASVVVETANYPVTPEGEAALIDRGVTIVPDILASGGGVSVSYLEWVQDLQRQQWPEERVNSDLTQIMRGATEQVLARADVEGCSLREAAYLIAVDRVAQAEIARGYR